MASKKTKKTSPKTKKGKTRKGKKTTSPKTKKTKTKKTTKTTTKTTKTTTTKTTGHKAPAGFSISPGQSSATDIIRNRLNDTRDRLFQTAGIGSRPYIHQYANGEIDGELMIPVPRGTTAVQVSQQLEQAFEPRANGMDNRFWFSLGSRLSLKKDEADERSGSARIRGADSMEMYYRQIVTGRQSARGMSTNLIDAFLRSQKQMIPGAEKKYRRKVEHVYIRIHWNPKGSKPDR